MLDSTPFWGLHHFSETAKGILDPAAVECHLNLLKQGGNSAWELKFCELFSRRVQSIIADIVGGVGMQEIIENIIDREPLQDPSPLSPLAEEVDRTLETDYASLVPTLQIGFLWLQRLEKVLSETDEDYLQAAIGIQRTGIARGLFRAKKCCTDLCENFTVDQFERYQRARKSEKGLKGREQEIAGNEAMAKMELLLACEGAEFQARLFCMRDIRDYEHEVHDRIMELMNVALEHTKHGSPMDSYCQKMAINWGEVITEANVGLRNVNDPGFWH